MSIRKFMYDWLQQAIALLPHNAFGQTIRRSVLRSYLRSCGAGLEVFPGTVIYYPENVEMGSHVSINRNCIIVAKAPIRIGNDVLIGPGTLMHTANHRYADPTRPIRTQGYEEAPIVIEDDVWIGGHCVVLAGTELGRGCVVAAGAVVRGRVPPMTVVAGVPARPVKARS